MDFLSRLRTWLGFGPPALPTVAVSALPPMRYRFHDGEKFPGGFGPTELLTADYWTLRARSAQLFELNLYARGLIRRLVTNEINTGLHLEATPEETLLGFPEDGLADWAEDVENRFSLWEDSPRLCDHQEMRTFGALQCAARQEALICGDVLVTIIQDARTSLPRVLLIDGNAVCSPLGTPQPLAAGHRIVHGVELDADGRHIAFWIRKPDAGGLLVKFDRLPAYGPKTGRRQAWLYYGTDKREADVRGKPILALVAQSLNEIDRYRDSVQRKAVINAMIAMFVKKTENVAGSRPIGAGAFRRGTETAVDQKGEERSFNIADMIPGVVFDELAFGEEPVGFTPQGTDEKFGDFEEAIIQAVAWAHEIPPEILRLSFSSNYSASQAAINEFKIYLNKLRATFGQQFCQPIYEDWLLSQALRGKLTNAAVLEAWRAAEHETVSAWQSSDWTGHIKPAVDLSKLVRGYDEMVAAGFITRDRASRELTGTKYSKNVQKLARENKQLAEANKPLAKPTAAPKAKSKPPVEPEENDAAARRPRLAAVTEESCTG